MQKIRIWVVRSILVILILFSLFQILVNPIGISIFITLCLLFLAVINEDKITVFDDRLIYSSSYFLGLYNIDKECIFLKDISKVETNENTLLDDIFTYSADFILGSKIYINMKDGTNKTLETKINNAEISEITQLINNIVKSNI